MGVIKENKDEEPISQFLELSPKMGVVFDFAWVHNCAA
jgi:hypothetical protein